MAKKTRTSKHDDSNGSEGVSERLAPNVPTPEGYFKQSTDIIGFWNPDVIAGKTTAIHFVPLEVKLFDSRIEPLKPSAIIVGKLVDPIPMSAPGGEDEVVECASGDIIGVWYKAGMSAIKQLGGVKVFMYPTGEIDTGKPNPMVTYDVLSKTKGTELHVTLDARKKSRHVETTFVGARGDAKANAQHAPEQGADDIPF
jgi:hypothetical protein